MCVWCTYFLFMYIACIFAQAPEFLFMTQFHFVYVYVYIYIYILSNYDSVSLPSLLLLHSMLLVRLLPVIGCDSLTIQYFIEKYLYTNVYMIQLRPFFLLLNIHFVVLYMHTSIILCDAILNIISFTWSALSICIFDYIH